MKRDTAIFWVVLFLAACVLGSFGNTAAAQAASDEWQFFVAPYGWATALGADVSKGDSSISSHMSMGDVIENLDFAFFLHAEAKKGPWGVYADFIYAKIGDNGTLELPGPGELDTKVELKEYVAELGGIYTIDKGEHAFDILYGGRYFYIKTEAGIGQQHTSISVDWLDPVLGGRYRTQLADKWAFSFRGDIGGFGVGSDFTWNLSTVFQYAIKENIDLAFGYRYMNVDYETSGGTDLDMEIYGPLIGAVFKF